MRTAVLAVAAERFIGAVSLVFIGFTIGSLAVTLWGRLTHRT